MIGSMLRGAVASAVEDKGPFTKDSEFCEAACQALIRLYGDQPLTTLPVDFSTYKATGLLAIREEAVRTVEGTARPSISICSTFVVSVSHNISSSVQWVRQPYEHFSVSQVDAHSVKDAMANAGASWIRCLITNKKESIEWDGVGDPQKLFRHFGHIGYYEFDYAYAVTDFPVTTSVSFDNVFDGFRPVGFDYEVSFLDTEVSGLVNNLFGQGQFGRDLGRIVLQYSGNWFPKPVSFFLKEPRDFCLVINIRRYEGK
jgi:hypothetical protein